MPATLRFILSRHTRCVRCGRTSVKRLRERDGVDRVSRNAVSLVFSLVGAPIHHCGGCRLQYYDCRPIDVVAGVIRGTASSPTRGRSRDVTVGPSAGLSR
jgi:hypothetical protein